MAQPEGRSAAYNERQAFEVELANLETRLRGTISDLVQPTIQRTTLVCADLDQMKNQVAQHTRGLQEVQLGQFKVLEQMGTIASFKEEMSRWDQQRRQHETSIDEKTEAVQQKMEGFRYSLEQKESALHHLHRSIDRMATELNHTVEEQEQQKEHIEQRLDEQSKRLNKAKSEMDITIAGLELKHNALTDQLWGEETGLAKVAGELRKTNAAFGELEASVAELKEGKAEASQLDLLHSEVGKMVHEANTAVMAMRQTVGNVVNDVREHFRTASQTISAHNATFISEVRDQYQNELANAAKLRDEVQDFMAQMAKSIDSLDARVAGAASKADALAAEAREEVEELNKRRKRDKTTSDNELKALKSKLKGVFDTNDAVRAGLEHISKVMNTMIESELKQCSVELQDSVDRTKIALLGVKDDEVGLSRSCNQEQLRPRAECRTKGASATAAYPKQQGGKLRGGPGSLSKPQEPVIRVDNRCLSCSGQAPLVLSAFKMACLQYTPSPVDYEGGTYDRGELLARRHHLLQGAHSELLEVSAMDATNPPVGKPLASATTDSASGEMFSEYVAMETRQQQRSNVKLPQVTQAFSGALTAR